MSMLDEMLQFARSSKCSDLHLQVGGAPDVYKRQGEESGRLDEMLTTLADDFDYDSEMASQRMVTVIEPIMIVVMAVMVVIVMMGVLLPVVTLYIKTVVYLIYLLTTGVPVSSPAVCG